MLEPDTHPPFDIMEGGRPLKKPKKAKKAKGEQEVLSARQRVLQIKRNTMKKKVSNVRVVSQKRVAAAQQKQIVAAKKVESFKKAAAAIKKNVSKKVLPKNVKRARVSKVQKDALIKSKISGIRSRAKLDMDKSRLQLRVAAKNRVRITKDISVARTKLRLNNLVRQRMETRLPSQRKAVSDNMTANAKNHETNIQLMRSPNSIVDKSMKNLPTEGANLTKIKGDLDKFPEKIRGEKGKLKAHDKNRTDAAKDIDGFKSKAGDASRDAETARGEAGKVTNTLGDSTRGKIKELNDMDRTIKNRPADPRATNAQKASSDGDGFKKVRDGADDPTKNGVNNKTDANTKRGDAAKDAVTHDGKRGEAKVHQEQKIKDLNDIQKNHDSFVGGLKSNADTTLTKASTDLNQVGKNRDALKDQADTATSVRTRKEELESQNKIDQSKRSDEVSDRWTDVGNNDTTHKKCNTDTGKINDKLNNDLGPANKRHKDARDAAEGKLIPPKHDTAHAPDVARLSEIKMTKLPKAKDDLADAKDSLNRAEKSKERLPPDQVTPDLAPLKNKQEALSKELDNAKGIRDPAAASKTSLDTDIRTRTRERNALNEQLSDLKGRIDSYSPVKQSPPKVDIDKLNDTKNTAIIGDRDKSSKTMTDSAKKHQITKEAVISKTKDLTRDTSKLDVSVNDNMKVSIKKERIAKSIRDQTVNKQGHDIDRKAAAADINGFFNARKQASKDAVDVNTKAGVVSKSYNDKMGEYRALDSITSGPRKKIEDNKAAAKGANDSANIQSRMRDESQTTSIKRSKERDVADSERVKGATDSKKHQAEANNAAKRKVDADMGLTNAKGKNVLADISDPSATGKYSKALNDVGGNVTAIKNNIATVGGKRKGAEELEAQNKADISKKSQEVVDRSKEVGDATQARERDIRSIDKHRSDLGELGGKPLGLKTKRDSALAKAEEIRPQRSADYNDMSRAKAKNDEYLSGSKNELDGSVRRKAAAEDGQKGLVGKTDVKKDTNMADKLKGEKDLKQARKKEEDKVKVLNKKKKALDDKVKNGNKSSNSNMLLLGLIQSVIGGLAGTGLAPGTLIAPGITIPVRQPPPSDPSSSTPELDPSLSPGTDTSAGSDYASGYAEGMAIGKKDGQNEGTEKANKIINRLQTETEEELIKEQENIMASDVNLDVATAQLVKQEYCKAIASGAKLRGIDPSIADSSCLPLYTGTAPTFGGGYQEDENGVMIPSMKVLHGGYVAPSAEYDTGFAAGYKNGYSLWYNASLKVTLSVEAEVSIMDKTPVTQSTSTMVMIEPSQPGTPEASGASGAEQRVQSLLFGFTTPKATSTTKATESGASGAAPVITTTPTATTKATESGASGASESGASGASGSSGASSNQGGGALKNAKRHLKRGNTFKQHAHLLQQIKNKPVSV